MAKKSPTVVRLPPALTIRIDQLRGLVPREAYVRYLLGEQVGREEAKQKKMKSAV